MQERTYDDEMQCAVWLRIWPYMSVIAAMKVYGSEEPWVYEEHNLHWSSFIRIA